VQVPQNAFVQPTETPKELPKVEVATTPTPTIDLTPSQPSEPSGGETGGVKGGVEGGVAGGVQGGVVGGQVGGQLGGVLGGKLGGTGTGTEGEGKEAAPPPEAKPEGPLRVGGDVKAPVAVKKIEPNYTDVARKASIAGIVIVEAIIDEHGNVDNVKVIKGLPMGLSEEAVEAVKKWKFRPGTLNGDPIPVIFNLTVNFTLNSK
jgi:protein TonB